MSSAPSESQPAGSTVGPATHELADEQRVLDAAYAAIESAVSTIRRRLQPGSDGAGVDETASDALSHHWADRLRGHLLRPGAPFFGRIYDEHGHTHHIGPHAIYDEHDRLLTLNWRVPVAEPFYLATPDEPHGLTRRRRFAIDDVAHRVRGFEDERFDDDLPARDTGLDAAIEDVLGERSAQMRTIVATIRPDQYTIIRQPADGPLFVYGGPGTGKSAVGLHRAAWLLFRDDRLARQGVLVVGPNRIFMDYIGVVLPSLGEDAVEQRALTDIPPVRARGVDAPAVARVKGDIRMVEVVRCALRQQIRHPRAGATIRVGRASVDVPRDLIAAALAAGLDAQRPYQLGRERFARELRARLVQHVEARRPPGAGDVEIELSGNRDLLALVGRVWPSLTSERFVGGLLGSRRRLARAAEGILTADEIELLVTAAADGRWPTRADAVLIDETEELLRGASRVYGHVVVDEVQDLSAMELRMLARRSSGRSMTLLGDPAQATGDGALGADALEASLGVETVRRMALEVSYRVPREFVELAARLLPLIAPGLQPPSAVRAAEQPIRVEAAAVGELPACTVDIVADLVARPGSVAVIAPGALTRPLIEAMQASGLVAADPRDGGLGARVAVAPPTAMKGLEFDSVVVVEPAAIAEGSPRGLNELYVSLTRATRRLAIVHEAPLPVALETPEGGA